MNGMRCCNLLSDQLGTLTQRPVHPASPVLLTKNGPLGTINAYNPLLSKFSLGGELTTLKVRTLGPENLVQDTTVLYFTR